MQSVGGFLIVIESSLPELRRTCPKPDCLLRVKGLASRRPQDSYMGTKVGRQARIRLLPFVVLGAGGPEGRWDRTDARRPQPSACLTQDSLGRLPVETGISHGDSIGQTRRPGSELLIPTVEVAFHHRTHQVRAAGKELVEHRPEYQRLAVVILARIPVAAVHQYPCGQPPRRAQRRGLSH